MHPYFDLIDLFSEIATKQKYWKQNTFLLWFLEDGDKKSITLCVSWTMFATFLHFCIAYGLKCYRCDPGVVCSTVVTCASGFNRCFSAEYMGELALQIEIISAIFIFNCLVACLNWVSLYRTLQVWKPRVAWPASYVLNPLSAVSTTCVTAPCPPAAVRSSCCSPRPSSPSFSEAPEQLQLNKMCLLFLEP